MSGVFVVKVGECMEACDSPRKWLKLVWSDNVEGICSAREMGVPGIGSIVM